RARTSRRVGGPSRYGTGVARPSSGPANVSCELKTFQIMRLFYRLRLGALLMLGCLGLLLPTQLQAQERPVKDHRGTVAVPFTVAPGKHVAQNEEVLRYYNPEAEAFYVEDFFAEIPSFLVRISPSLTGELTELSFPLYNGPLLEGGSSIGVDGDGQVRVDLFEVEDPNVLPLLEEQGIA